MSAATGAELGLEAPLQTDLVAVLVSLQYFELAHEIMIIAIDQLQA